MAIPFLTQISLSLQNIAKKENLALFQPQSVEPNINPQALLQPPNNQENDAVGADLSGDNGSSQALLSPPEQQELTINDGIIRRLDLERLISLFSGDDTSEEQSFGYVSPVPEILKRPPEVVTVSAIRGESFVNPLQNIEMPQESIPINTMEMPQEELPADVVKGGSFTSEPTAKGGEIVKDDFYVYRGIGKNQGSEGDFLPGAISYTDKEELAMQFGNKIESINIKGKRFLNLDEANDALVKEFEKLSSKNPKDAAHWLKSKGYDGVKFNADAEDPNLADELGPMTEYRLLKNNSKLSPKEGGGKSLGAGASGDIPLGEVPLIDMPSEITVRTMSGEKKTIRPDDDEEFSIVPVQKPNGKTYYQLHDGEVYDIDKNIAQNLIGRYGKKPTGKIEMPEGVEEAIKNQVKGVVTRGPVYAPTMYGPDTHPDMSLPGGENYREVLIKASAPEVDALPTIIDIEKTESGVYRVLLSNGEDYRFPTADTETEAREQAFAMIPRDYRKGGIYQAGVFESSHWDEPNVLAHLRLNERTTPDGKKVLFVEELQRDWARAGRQAGFREQLSPQEKREYDILSTKKLDYPAKITPAEDARLEELNDRWMKPSTPNHPLLKSWQELALKRVIKEAVEGGYDYISWTTGEQQAERYDLSKRVDFVGYNKTNGNLTANKDGKVILMKKNIKPEDIGKYIGKDRAEKILRAERGKDGWAYLESEDLKIGGEWAKNLYDRQVPNMLKDLTKGNVENIQISGKEHTNDTYMGMGRNDQLEELQRQLDDGEITQRQYNRQVKQLKEVEDAVLSQPALKITPEIRKAITGNNK